MSALLDMNSFLNGTNQSLRRLSDPGRQASNPGWRHAPTINRDDTVCNICQEEYNQGSQPEIPLTLPCGHAFGSVCIAQWLHVQNRNHGCPICRNMPFGIMLGGEDLEDGEIAPEEEEEGDGDDAMSETSDSDETVPGFSRNRAFVEYMNNDAGFILANMGDELPDAMRGFLGRNHSTELITQMVRTGDTRGMFPNVFALLLSDHGQYQVPHLSYRQATIEQYANLNRAVQLAAAWLHGRATDYVMQELMAHLARSQRESAQDFLKEDKLNLSLIIQCGLFHSRWMVGTFDIRIGLAKHISRVFEDPDHWTAAFRHRVVEAMPRLTAVYRRVIDDDSSTIPEEINFKELWDADMTREPLHRAPVLPPTEAGIPAFWRDNNEMPPPRRPTIETRQPADSARQAPAEQSTLFGATSIFTSNNENRFSVIPPNPFTGVDWTPRGNNARRPLSEEPVSPLTTTHSASRAEERSAPPSDPTPSSVEQARHRVLEAAHALADAGASNPAPRGIAERPTLAPNDPLRLPSLADLEEQARDQVPAYVTVETRDLPSRNRRHRRNATIGRTLAGRGGLAR